MPLQQRLNRLERSIGACPECGGHGKPVVTVVYEGEPEPPVPPGCSSCGKRHHVQIRYVRKKPLPDEDAAEEADP